MTRQTSWLRVFVEGLVIVVSILLAFGIDAWWEGRKEDARRVDLLEALQSDFTSTRDLLTASLDRGERVSAASAGFQAAAASSDDLPADSIRVLASSAFSSIQFTPAIANYQAAIATGEIGLIESDSLLIFLNQFDRGLRGYDQHNVLSGEIFYWGPVHDVRREFGSTRGFLETASEDLPEVIRNRTIRAAAESMMIVHASLVGTLIQMDQATSKVLRELERLLAGS